MATSITADTVLERNPAILFNDFDDGIMMMDIESGLYFDVDPIGSRIWNLLEAPTSLAQICNSLVNEFEVDEPNCIADTAEFLSDLVDKGLLKAV
jgi:hypothetical protein